MNINYLIEGIEDNDTSRVEKALSYKYNLCEVDDTGYFPLSCAVRNYESKGNLKIIQLLLDKGADVNQQTPENETMLIWAAGISKIELVDLLLKYSPAPNVVNHYNHTALLLFTTKDKTVVNHFIRNYKDLEQLNKFKEQAEGYSLDENHQIHLLETIDKHLLNLKLSNNLVNKVNKKSLKI